MLEFCENVDPYTTYTTDRMKLFISRNDQSTMLPQ